MRAVIIGNPAAGRSGNEQRMERCAKILRYAGYEAEIWPTEYPAHATELATLAGDDLVVAAGGDGTINEVINGLSTDATLGILPLGTANVLAREIGLPLNLDAASEKIATGAEFRMDLGIATDDAGVERRFACMAGLGFDANVVKAVTPTMKRSLGTLAFALTAFRVYFEGNLPGMEIFRDGVSHDVQFAIVANARHYGGEFQVSDGNVRSGEFSLIMVPRVGALMRPDRLGRILARRPLSSFMPCFEEEEIFARPKEGKVLVQLDGEAWGQLPMSFRIAHESLRVIR
ncbi:MAG: hypothetical protein L0G70_05545 [Rubrobacter sp.]|nr:hypothetical protein [Rubrobacter sp.]